MFALSQNCLYSLVYVCSLDHSLDLVAKIMNAHLLKCGKISILMSILLIPIVHHSTEILHAFKTSFINIMSNKSPKQCPSDVCSNNGICFEESSNTLRCRCYPGFIGDRCVILQSVHSETDDSYMKLTKPNVIPRSNITIVFSTKHSNGVLVYFGHLGHMVAEIFIGKIRVSYDVENAPGTVMFSNTVNDGKNI